jgi:hypothetical protein
VRVDRRPGESNLRIVTAARFALACAVLFVTAILWNGFVHGVLLRGADAAVSSLHRPDLAQRLWLSLVLTAAFVTLFAAGFALFVRTRTVRDAMIYSLFFAAVAGVLVDFNQYVQYPIPGSLAFTWWLGGLLEFVVYGLILRGLWQPR